jgi:hypothetical protein
MRPRRGRVFLPRQPKSGGVGPVFPKRFMPRNTRSMWLWLPAADESTQTAAESRSHSCHEPLSGSSSLEAADGCGALVDEIAQSFDLQRGVKVENLR